MLANGRGDLTLHLKG